MPWRPHSPAAAAFKPRAAACAHRLAHVPVPACCCRRTDNLFQSLEERTLTDEEQRIIEQRVRRLLCCRQRRRLAAAVGCWRCGGAWRAGAGGRLVGTGQPACRLLEQRVAVAKCGRAVLVPCRSPALLPPGWLVNLLGPAAVEPSHCLVLCGLSAAHRRWRCSARCLRSTSGGSGSARWLSCRCVSHGCCSSLEWAWCGLGVVQAGQEGILSGPTLPLHNSCMLCMPKIHTIPVAAAACRMCAPTFPRRRRRKRWTCAMAGAGQCLACCPNAATQLHAVLHCPSLLAQLCTHARRLARSPAHRTPCACREDEAAAQLVSDAGFRLRVQAACGLIAEEPAAPAAVAAPPARREGSSECGCWCQCWVALQFHEGLYCRLPILVEVSRYLS